MLICGITETMVLIAIWITYELGLMFVPILAIELFLIGVIMASTTTATRVFIVIASITELISVAIVV
jgi:hypothetical protein